MDDEQFKELKGLLVEIRDALVVKAVSAKTDAFESFWNAFPKQRRKAKKDTREAWEKATVTIMEQDQTGWTLDGVWSFLVARAKSYAESDHVKSGYAMMPTTWLNQGRYDDTDESWSQSGPQPLFEGSGGDSEWGKI